MTPDTYISAIDKCNTEILELSAYNHLGTLVDGLLHLDEHRRLYRIEKRRYRQFNKFMRKLVQLENAGLIEAGW